MIIRNSLTLVAIFFGLIFLFTQITEAIANSNKEEYMINFRQAVEILRPVSLSKPDILEAYNKQYRILSQHTFADQLTGLLNDAYNVINNQAKYYVQKDLKPNDGSVLDQIKIKLEALPADSKLIIELKGSWIWISGNTFDNKDILKSLKFRFNRELSMWYWAENYGQKLYSTTAALGQES